MAQGLTAIDDFAFTGRGGAVLVALDHANEVAIVQPDGSHHIVLTAADGLSDPTSIAVRGSRVYVASGATSLTSARICCSQSSAEAPPAAGPPPARIHDGRASAFRHPPSRHAVPARP